MEQLREDFKKWLRSRHALEFAIVVLVVIGFIGVLWSATARVPQTVQPTASPSPSSSPTPVPSASPKSIPLTISTGRTPEVPFKLPPGYVVHIFAEKFTSARDLQFSPGGTLLVSDPAASTVTALPDANNDGVADALKQIISGGANVHGLAFYGGKLFVAKTDRVERYSWDEGTLTANLDKVLFSLPANANHNKRTIAFDSTGRLFVSVGSTCNVCREPDSRSATIMESDADGNNPRVFAAGLRNAPFMALNPTSGELWATEMGRDHLGDNIPPDEINIVRKDQNYGWPLCYGAKVHDTNFDTTATGSPCASTIAPIFPVPAHNAPLGLAFIKSTQFPAGQQGDLLVAYHGSWNRTIPDGYKVVRLTVRGNTITKSEDFMTGFINGRTVSARPVDVAFDSSGNLYVSDDKAGAVYIVQKP